MDVCESMRSARFVHGAVGNAYLAEICSISVKKLRTNAGIESTSSWHLAKYIIKRRDNFGTRLRQWFLYDSFDF